MPVRSSHPSARSPRPRRLGWFGNLSFATAPAAGFWLWQHGIEREQFLWSVGLALVGALILSRLPAETGRRVRRCGVNGALAIISAGSRTALLAARSDTPLAVIVAGMCMGIAWSAVVPVGIGLLFERSSPGTRGAAMGSYDLAFSIGMTVGSIVAAAAAALGGGYTLAMSICAATSLIALPWLFFAGPARPPRTLALRLTVSRA
jgi:hypothetical protein